MMAFSLEGSRDVWKRNKGDVCPQPSVSSEVAPVPTVTVSSWAWSVPLFYRVEMNLSVPLFSCSYAVF